MFSNANIKSAMNLDTPNEKRVTHHAFEQTYFTNDALVGNNNYTFQFPETWSGLPTKKKAIGFRYAKRKVNSYYIWFEFELIATYEDGSGGTETTAIHPKGEVKLAVTSENSVDEIVHEITKQMNAVVQNYNVNIGNNAGTDYDRFQGVEIVGMCDQSEKKDGSLSVMWISHGSYTPEGKSATIRYVLYCDIIDGFRNCFRNFLKFFNQDESTASVNGGKIVFDNVWDRKTLYIHSDVVKNTNYLLMDREGTFYRKPSKIYEHGYNGNVFHIWVSFDGKTRANLLYENVEIALTFYADVEDNYT